MVWSSCIYYSNWIFGRTSRASLQIASVTRYKNRVGLCQNVVQKGRKNA